MYKNVSGQINDPVSPRVYLLDESGQNYETLYLLNQELTFEVDVSNLPCGMNGAFYLTSMPADGGRNAKNPAGATYGTGYCDAQARQKNWKIGLAPTDRILLSVPSRPSSQVLQTRTISEHAAPKWISGVRYSLPLLI